MRCIHLGAFTKHKQTRTDKAKYAEIKKAGAFTWAHSPKTNKVVSRRLQQEKHGCIHPNSDRVLANKELSAYAENITTLVQAGRRARTNAGDPICFGYNLGTCNLPVNQGRCDRGFHVCAIPKCGKHHPFSQCNAKKETGSGLDPKRRSEDAFQDGNALEDNSAVGS